MLSTAEKPTWFRQVPGLEVPPEPPSAWCKISGPLRSTKLVLCFPNNTEVPTSKFRGLESVSQVSQQLVPDPCHLGHVRRAVNVGPEEIRAAQSPWVPFSLALA